MLGPPCSLIGLDGSDSEGLMPSSDRGTSSKSRPQYGTEYWLAMWPGAYPGFLPPWGGWSKAVAVTWFRRQAESWEGSQEGNPERHQVCVSNTVLQENRDKSSACHSRILILDTISSDTILLLSRALHIINESLSV